MKHKRRLVLAALLIIVAGALYYFYVGSSTPVGQPPLVYLTAANFSELQQAFNASKDFVRVVTLLSPT